jgi:hypothetical protein
MKSKGMLKAVGKLTRISPAAIFSAIAICGVGMGFSAAESTSGQYTVRALILSGGDRTYAEGKAACSVERVCVLKAGKDFELYISVNGSAYVVDIYGPNDNDIDCCGYKGDQRKIELEMGKRTYSQDIYYLYDKGDFSPPNLFGRVYLIFD